MTAHTLAGRLLTVGPAPRGIHPQLWAGVPQPAPTLEETA